MSNGFKFDTSKLLNALVSREMKTKAALGAYADTSSQLLESTAKNDRPWKDHTHDAKNRLHGSWEWQGDTIRIALSHGVDYGLYLEKGTGPHVIEARPRSYLFWDGASHPVKKVNHPGSRPYPIIMPTIEKCAPSIIRGLDVILK
ncbi:hypothetical protein OKS01_17595 [Clostridioides difficile]|nr:hypothetical protein [Clostridioides difficile]